MLALLKHFERLIAWGLGALLMLVILAATVDLAITLFKGALNGTSHFLIGIDHVIDLLGQFLIVLLGLELLDTVKAYLHDDLIHVAVVLVVAIIALARKVIVLEVKETSPLTLVGLAALVLSLAPAIG